MGMALHLNKLESSSVLYVKYGGTWHGDSEEVNMCKYMDGHLNRETDDRQTDRQTINRCFAKHNRALSSVEQIHVNKVKCFDNKVIIGLILHCHDKNIKLLSDCFKDCSFKAMKWILLYQLHVLKVKITNISKFKSE